LAFKTKSGDYFHDNFDFGNSQKQFNYTFDDYTIPGRYINNFKKDHAYFQNKLINDYAIAKGVNIKNIIPEGFESPVFEKISWVEVQKILKT
jgi:hypothetical protein